MLLKTLRKKDVPEFRVKWPTSAEKITSSNLFRYNRQDGIFLPKLFAVMDGCRLLCADCESQDLQNAYYKGYTGNVEVTNLLVFNFYEEIIHKGVNYPGGRHENKLVVALDCLQTG